MPMELEPVAGLSASAFITRSLRLINVPGRGADLDSEDLTDAFQALQEIIQLEGVSQFFIPGIRRHFFNLQSGKTIYKYGVGPQADWRSDDFSDPAPIRIEGAYVRQGSTITDNEQVGDWRLENAGDWATTGTTDIANNQAYIAGIGTLSQTLGLTSGTTYTLRLGLVVGAGDIVLQLQGDAIDVTNLVMDSSGAYEFEFEFTGTTSEIILTTDDAADEVTVQYVSLIERGKDRLELPDSSATDYPVQAWDQRTYNSNTTKAVGGRPGYLLFSRSHDLAEVRLSSLGGASDVLVMDVMTNSAMVEGVNDELKIHGNALLWLRYRLAEVVAPEYGKSLSMRQTQLMDEAYSLMAAGNARPNHLRTELGRLNSRGHGRFDIDGGH